jgi:hypothetical protein
VNEITPVGQVAETGRVVNVFSLRVILSASWIIDLPRTLATSRITAPAQTTMAVPRRSVPD